MDSELTRREVIAAGAAGLLGAAAMGVGRARGAGGAAPLEQETARRQGVEGAGDTARTLRKAVLLGMVAEGDTVLEKFRLLKECGFDGVEMDSPSPQTDWDEVAAARDATGIVVHGVVHSQHWRLHLNSEDASVREQGVGALRTALHDARRVGASSVLLVPAVVNAAQTYARAWELSIASIREALPAAREAGVTIAIENVWNGFLLSPLEAARYIDAFDDPHVRFYFDVGNIINFGWPAHWVEALGTRIAKVHVKDFSRKKRDDEGLWKGFSAEIGEGDADWPKVMRALDATGYATDPAGRWATAEVSGGGRERLMEISRRMDMVLSA
ncbi:MAG: sugar phosphate isomerase/epimerase [Phycisphaeraceae bacterium]|nr:sugar phosphate isomerase/epimerase [Phycisphaeraceae bacterium]